MIAQRSYSFIGCPSGDCECFCWEIKEAEHLRIEGKKWHDDEVRFRKKRGIPTTVPFRLYPGAILRKMEACQESKLYKFTIIAEEVGEAPKEWLEK